MFSKEKHWPYVFCFFLMNREKERKPKGELEERLWKRKNGKIMSYYSDMVRNFAYLSSSSSSSDFLSFHVVCWISTRILRERC